MKSTSKDQIAFPPAMLHILLSLMTSDLHGYGIIREVLRQSEGKVRIGPGTLYDNLKRLMEQGLIADVPPNKNEERRLYKLTLDGRTAIGAEIARLDRMIAQAKSKLATSRTRRAT